MKIILLLIIGFLTFSLPVRADLQNLLDPYKLVYDVIDSNGAHVSGQTITLSIEKSSNQYFYDFADSTFKASGWTNKTTTLTEDSTNGLYYYSFQPPASETSANQYIFIVNNSDATYADHQQQIVSYDDIATNVNVLKSRGR